LLFSTVSRPSLGPNQPPVRLGPAYVSPEASQGLETDHSPTSGTEVTNAWSHNSTSKYIFDYVVINEAQR
jgi:hypothetical protein